MDCPLPTPRYTHIVPAHGGGGTLTDDLLRTCFLPAFGTPAVGLHDAALLDNTTASADGQTAVTTDSFVIHPLVFPGGDIGSLAVNGSVNDLLMIGARPLALTAAFILEEGLPLDTLRRITASMAAAAEHAGVRIAAGDTKVVERGRGDGIYITTTGIGRLAVPAPLLPSRIQPGDAILLTGSIARHAMAVMACRMDLDFNPPIQSDCASLHAPFLDLFAQHCIPHCARDATRGGLGGVLCELARAAHLDMEINEPAIPVDSAVQNACGLLGFDPLFMANEGCAVLLMPPGQAAAALDILRRHPATRDAVCIGRVGDGTDGAVTAVTALGTRRRLLPPAGEQLPRIC